MTLQSLQENYTFECFTFKIVIGDEMKKSFIEGIFLPLAMSVLLFNTGLLSSQKPSGYHLIKKTVLGGEGFWDYLALDT